jgi:hypothetical protein
MTSVNDRWGPLAALAGEWEGNEGLDVAFSHQRGVVFETPYRETVVLKPFGPVDNGTQCLYGLDYRMAAWREGEDNPFHTEVGYWLYAADLGQVMRSFMVPRGSVVLAGGDAAPDARSFSLSADCGSEVYGILSNPYLATNARSASYRCTITVDDDDTWRYEQDTLLEMANLDEPLHHTDRNVMRRTAAAEFPPLP